MSLPNPKEVKKLADVCRKAGIRHFKSADFEFTLDLDAQVIPVNSKTKVNHGTTDKIETNTLSEEALLLWSTPNPEEIAGDS